MQRNVLKKSPCVAVARHHPLCYTCIYIFLGSATTAKLLLNGTDSIHTYVIFLQVFSSVFVVTIIFAPLFGKYLAKLGSRPLFLCGTLTTGTTTIIFGLLQWVEDGTLFFWLSLIIRILSAIGESAYFSALYPLVAQVHM